MAARKLSSVFDASRISGEQRAYIPLFGSKTGHHGEIHIPRDARFPPPLAIAEILQLSGGREEIHHRGSFANQCCISTIPEDGLSGAVRNA